jgi:CRISPR/Cas system-associated exonuclease Cas4 (RecB family)
VLESRRGSTGHQNNPWFAISRGETQEQTGDVWFGALAWSGSWRITDHKTGKNRSKEGLIIGGGETLQPVLYSVAIEKGLKTKVETGRLYFCTTAGGFGEHAITIDDYARTQGLLALTVVDRSVELGLLPAAPRKDACRWCDFRPVCGAEEERRVSKKPEALLADLHSLRELR